VVRTILTNQGQSGGSYTLTTQGMQFSNGETAVDVFTCNKYKASSKGEVDVKMGGGNPVVLLPESALKKSGLCGYN
jgi:alpha-amylase